jgi:hypothetical protein
MKALNKNGALNKNFFNIFTSFVFENVTGKIPSNFLVIVINDYTVHYCDTPVTNRLSPF